MRHKIDVLRLNQQKIREEEKSLLASRGITDEQHEQMKDKITAELEQVLQKERIVKIIHETYVKELLRVKEAME